MNDDNNDYDPEVESLLEYCARKVREGDHAPQAPTRPLATHVGPAAAYEIQAALHELLEVQTQAVSVEGFIFTLRSVASRLEQQADRLQACGVINFHVCYVLQ